MAMVCFGGSTLSGVFTALQPPAPALANALIKSSVTIPLSSAVFLAADAGLADNLFAGFDAVFGYLFDINL
jgi:hypothetical protein